METDRSSTLATKEPPKSDGDKKPDAKTDDKKSDAPVVPDKYEFKAPEGYEINDEVIADATPIFKELNLTQDQAQKLFDVYAKHATKSQEALVEHFETMRADWRKEIISDRTIGNGTDGLAPEASQNIAALKNHLPPELKASFEDAMNLTGAGDNPAFIRAMSILGKAFREGTHVRGGNPSPAGQRSPNSGPRSAASAIFPNLPSSSSAS